MGQIMSFDYLITLREEISREENFAKFVQIREIKFLFWPPKISIREN